MWILFVLSDATQLEYKPKFWLTEEASGSNIKDSVELVLFVLIVLFVLKYQQFSNNNIKSVNIFKSVLVRIIIL